MSVETGHHAIDMDETKAYVDVNVTIALLQSHFLPKYKSSFTWLTPTSPELHASL
jgi:hypothetical protein